MVLYVSMLQFNSEVHWLIIYKNVKYLYEKGKYLQAKDLLVFKLSISGKTWMLFSYAILSQDIDGMFVGFSLCKFFIEYK